MKIEKLEKFDNYFKRILDQLSVIERKIDSTTNSIDSNEEEVYLDNQEKIEMKKKCFIYKTKNAYKIETLYRRVSKAYVADEPIFIVPLDASLEELSDKIFESLNASAEITEEDYFNQAGGIKEYLKKLKEKSLKSLYETSNYCQVSLENETIIVSPYEKDGRAISMVHGAKTLLPYSLDNQLDITQKIMDVLEVSYH